ncbi:MAG: hypothetical protein Q9O74_10000 [Planctomycetota bacterium]|nr:hypothetical protein [Planctomycetota bacterium]
MTEQPPRAGEPEPGDAANGPSDPIDPIDLEPRAQEPAQPKKSRTISSSGPGPANLDAPGLLDDFDEDADFESDPEVERVVKGIPVENAGSTAAAHRKSVFKPTGEPLCKSSAWKVPGTIGAGVTVLAAVLAGVYAEHSVWAYVLITLYWAVLHTAIGLGALVLSSLLLGRRVGSFEGAAARMLLAVSLFLVVYSLKIPITGGKLEEVILAAAVYFGGLVVAFRLAPRDAGVIGAAHFGVALLLVLGGLLQGAISSGAAG